MNSFSVGNNNHDLNFISSGEDIDFTVEPVVNQNDRKRKGRRSKHDRCYFKTPKLESKTKYMSFSELQSYAPHVKFRFNEIKTMGLKEDENGFFSIKHATSLCPIF